MLTDPQDLPATTLLAITLLGGIRLAMLTAGGGNFPHISTAPVLVNQQTEIRQLLIDYVVAQGTVDPADFAEDNWRLVRGGVPVFN